jgi:hypothetical protein
MSALVGETHFSVWNVKVTICYDIDARSQELLAIFSKIYGRSTVKELICDGPHCTGFCFKFSSSLSRMGCYG